VSHIRGYKREGGWGRDRMEGVGGRFRLPFRHNGIRGMTLAYLVCSSVQITLYINQKSPQKNLA